MMRFRNGLGLAWPAAAALGLGALILFTGATPGAPPHDAPAPPSAMVDIFFTGDLWTTFYPAGPASTEQQDNLRAILKELPGAPGARLTLDTGSFSSLTMLTETDYRPGALGIFLDHRFDAVNLGAQESLMAPIELEMLLRRAGDAGARAFVSSFNATETTFTPRWKPYIEVKKSGVPFIIGGISRDIQKTLFTESEPMFSGIDTTAYARQLVAAAKSKGAFPILLADTGEDAVEAIAGGVAGLPLILISSPVTAEDGQGMTRMVGQTLVVGQPKDTALAHVSIEVFPGPEPSAKILQKGFADFAAATAADPAAVRFWPAALPRAAEWPATARPEIGLTLENDRWLKMLGLDPEAVELNVISGAIMKKFPVENKTGHYYHISAANPADARRLIYIRHQLPHPYPGIYFLVLTDSDGKIKRLYFPLGVLLGARQSRLADWAKGMTEDNAAALEKKMATDGMEYFQAMLMADVYHALKVLDAGAL